MSEEDERLTVSVWFFTRFNQPLDPNNNNNNFSSSCSANNFGPGRSASGEVDFDEEEVTEEKDNRRLFRCEFPPELQRAELAKRVAKDRRKSDVTLKEKLSKLAAIEKELGKKREVAKQLVRERYDYTRDPVEQLKLKIVTDRLDMEEQLERLGKQLKSTINPEWVEIKQETFSEFEEVQRNFDPMQIQHESELRQMEEEMSTCPHRMAILSSVEHLSSSEKLKVLDQMANVSLEKLNQLRGESEVVREIIREGICPLTPPDKLPSPRGGVAVLFRVLEERRKILEENENRRQKLKEVEEALLQVPIREKSGGSLDNSESQNPLSAGQTNIESLTEELTQRQSNNQTTKDHLAKLTQLRDEIAAESHQPSSGGFDLNEKKSRLLQSIEEAQQFQAEKRQDQLSAVRLQPTPITSERLWLVDRMAALHANLQLSHRRCAEYEVIVRQRRMAELNEHQLKMEAELNRLRNTT